MEYQWSLSLIQVGKVSSEEIKVQQFLTWFKFPKSKTINEAILEIAVDTKSSFCPIWQIFLVVPFFPLRYSCQLVCSVLFRSKSNSIKCCSNSLRRHMSLLPRYIEFILLQKLLIMLYGQLWKKSSYMT